MIFQQEEAQIPTGYKGVFTDCLQVKFLTFHFAYIYQYELLNGSRQTLVPLEEIILSVDRFLHFKTT